MNIQDILQHKKRISPEKAKQYLEEIASLLQLSPHDVDLWRARAILFDKIGNYERAIEDITTAIELTPDNSELLQARTIYFIRAGRHQEALQDDSVLIDRNPKDARLRIARSRQYYRMNNLDLCLKDMWDGFRLGASSSLVVAGLSWQKFQAEAEAHVQQNPSVHGMNVLSLLYFMHHDEPKSIELLKKSLSIEVQLEAIVLLFHIYLSLNQLDDAAATLALAEPIAPNEKTVLIAKGYLNSYRGNRAEAIQYFTEALDVATDKATQQEMRKIISAVKRGKKQVEID